MLRWLSELSDEDCAAAGPKIARLGTLRRIGLDVPDGFVMTAAAYLAFVAARGLDRAIDREVASIADPDDFAAVERVSGTVRQIIETAPLEAEVESRLRDAYEELCFRYQEIDLAVAVRSSASGEDAAAASFAGQYESYLGVSGADNVVAAVRKVWGSLFAARALSYRLRQGQHHGKTPMGVGVLRLVPARCAGVAFTAHPVTKKHDRMVIEGSWGWGEAVVQGVVQPDHIELDKFDGRIIDYTVADKRIVSTFDRTHGGVIERDMPTRFRLERCLTPEMLDALWRAACTIEQHYGAPVDLEWVVELGWRPERPITIVQTRPITTLDQQTDMLPPKWDPLGYASKYGLGMTRKANPVPNDTI